MTTLITGITGFVGSALATHILNLPGEHQVVGLVRWRSPRDNLKDIINHPRLKLVEGDLLDLSSLIRILYDIRPEYIWHGAAQSYVRTSFNDPISTMQVNVMGSLNLLEAVRIVRQQDLDQTWEAGFTSDQAWDPKICLVSSSEVYGQPLDSELPMKETNPLRPTSPYAVSKASMDLMGRQYFENHGLKIIRTRMFSHDGSKRGDTFALSYFCKQAVAAGLQLTNGEIQHGNLESVRTWSHIDDAVKAYWLIKDCTPGEVYNIGGTQATTIKEALMLILSEALKRYPGTNYKLVQNPQLIRPTDITMQIPDVSKFKQQTGWTSEKYLINIIQDLLEFWDAELKLNSWKVKTVI